MSAAPTPQDENERLDALLALGILDTGRSAEFNIFPKLASNIFSAPIAAISLIDKDRQWFKASEGLALTETSRDASFCAHAILAPGEILCVPDATKDPRFCDNPLVTGELGLRFYIGVPISGPSGHALGALCVIDNKPRQALAHEIEQLQQLALGVETTLRLHESVLRLRKLATTDGLTGLANRATFDMRLRAALLKKSSPNLIGLLFLDLDGFKQINDLFGHAFGDATLCEVARRLTSACRAGDQAFRFGGDEFCIVAEGLNDLDSLRGLADRVHSAMAEPFYLEHHPIPLSASIGAALCEPGDAEPQAIMRDADAALYAAKLAGRGLTRFSSASSDEAAVSAGRKGLEERLRIALIAANKPFRLAMQPIFVGQTRLLTGFEALIRWQLPGGREMPPGDFIPVAEKAGLITLIDRWVLDQACSFAADWPDHLHVSVNVSAANFLTADLVEHVAETLARHRLAARRLRLEITETVLLRDPHAVRSKIDALRALGAQVVLDDFGTGYASLAYLRDYSFDGLKIDKSFVAGLETDAKSRGFVRAIIEMARTLDIRTTAEGVETISQLRVLRRKGVDSVQGFLLGHPMTTEAAAVFAATNASTPMGLSESANRRQIRFPQIARLRSKIGRTIPSADCHQRG